MTAQENRVENRVENSADRKRRRRRRWFALILLVGVPVVSMLAAEALMRGYVWARGWTTNCYAADIALFVPHEDRGYDLRPGFELRSGVFRMSVNAAGFRGPIVPRHRDDSDKLRIAVLGGSSVYGYLVNDGEEASQRLVEELGQQGVSAEVINAGVPGYNLYQTASRYRERVAPYSPDIVILYLGYNDLPYVTSSNPTDRKFRVKEGVFAPSWKRRLSPSVFASFVGNRLGLSTPQPQQHWSDNVTDAGKRQFRANYLALVERIRADGSRVIICSQALAAHQPWDSELVSFFPGGTEEQETAVKLAEWLHATLKELAEQTEVPMVPAYTEIPGTAEYLGDDVHLTRRGERRLAQLWAKAITEWQ